MTRHTGFGRGAAAAWRVSASLLVALGLLLLPASGFAFRGHGGGREGDRPARQEYHGGREGAQQRNAPRPQYTGPRQPYQNSYPDSYPGPGRNDAARPPYRGEQQMHLPAWLRGHAGMPLAQQQRALAREPGFNRLPPRTQRQLMNSLARIDGMPPRQRERTLGTIEALEHLSPQRRQQVMASERALRMMPQDRQRALKHAFQNLRNYPPAQRQTMMASPEFQSQFTPRERGILGDMLTVEPYEPPGR